MKKRILIFYDHFYPSYKAGGPTQSIVNLVRSLADEYDFFIVCKPYEHGERQILAGIIPDQWNRWEQTAKIFYWRYGWRPQTSISEIINQANPDVIYINGIYSPYFNFLPLWVASRRKTGINSVKVVVAPRGMLHEGALSQKSLKKKAYLWLFRTLGMSRKICWHATNEQEAVFIQNAMGTTSEIEVAPNFPNRIPVTAGPEKKAGELFLGTVALISPMKNHLLVLQALQACKEKIQWVIFGPVKDEAYWNECVGKISQLPSNIHVTYKGELPPVQLQQAMQQFQVFIMPSKSENFGHAIMEALSAGKPVITTSTTPFTDIEQFKCGVAVDPSEMPQALTHAIDTYAAMQAEPFAGTVTATQVYLNTKSDAVTLCAAYQSLFNCV